MAKRQSGTGTLIFKGADKPYLAQWTVAGSGKRMSRSTGETERSKALIKLREFSAPWSIIEPARRLEHLKAEMEIERANIKAYDQQGDGMPLSQMYFSYLMRAGQTWAEETHKQRRNQIENFVSWMGKSHPEVIYMKQVTVKMCKEYVECRMITTCITRCNQLIYLFRKVWTVLENEACLDSNPWKEVQKIKGDKVGNMKRVFSREQLKEILTHCKQTGQEDLHLIIMCAIYLGQREHDLLELKVGDFAFNHHTVYVMPHKVKKWLDRPLEIPIKAELQSLILKRIEQKNLTEPSHYLFSKDDDKFSPRWTPKQLSRKFSDLLDKLKIRRHVIDDRGKMKQCFNFHGLRAVFCSYAISAGFPTVLIRRITGHQDYETLEGYTKDVEQAMRRGIDHMPLFEQSVEEENLAKEGYTRMGSEYRYMKKGLYDEMARRKLDLNEVVAYYLKHHKLDKLPKTFLRDGSKSEKQGVDRVNLKKEK